MKTNWSIKSQDEVEYLLSTDAKNGLTSEIANIRLKEEGKNTLDGKEEVRVSSVLKSLFFDIAHLPILFAIIMSFSYRSYLLGILALIVWGAFIFAYTVLYLRAKRNLHFAANASVPAVCVLREGREKLLSPSLIVRGDIILLEEGDTVPCDAYILEACNLKVSEASAFDGGGVTQKSVRPSDAKQTEYGKMQNILFATSKVLSGKCKAICTETGHFTLAALQKRVSSLYGDTAPVFFTQIKKKVRPFSLSVIACSLLIVLIGFLYGENHIFSSFVTAACFVSSLLPASFEGILFVYYGIYMSALRRKKHARALLKNPLSLDLLPQLDCLFVNTDMLFDDDALALRSVITAKAQYHADELDSVKGLFSYAATLDTCIVAEYGSETAGLAQAPEKKAMTEFLAKKNIGLLPHTETIAYRSADADFDYNSVLLRDEQGGFIISSGDASLLLRACSSYLYENRIITLTAEIRERLLQNIDEMRRLGRSVITYAMKRTGEQGFSNSPRLHRDMTFILAAVFHKRESSSLERFLTVCKNQQIEPIIFYSGSAEQARLLIRDHHLFGQARVCDGSQIEDTPSSFLDLLDHYQIFAAFSQSQKQAMCNELIAKKLNIGLIVSSPDDEISFRQLHTVFAVAPPADFSLSAQKKVKKSIWQKKIDQYSDILIDKDVSAVTDAVDAMAGFRHSSRASVFYLMMMTAMRLLTCFCGALLGASFLPMLPLLMLTYLFDVLVVHHIFISGLSQKRREQIPFVRFDVLRSPSRAFNFFLPAMTVPLFLTACDVILTHTLPSFSHSALALTAWWSLTAVTLIYAYFTYHITFSKQIQRKVLPVLLAITLIGALPFVSTLFSVSFHWLSPIMTVGGILIFIISLKISALRERKYTFKKQNIRS